MPKEFNIDTVKDKDEEIKYQNEWYDNKKRKREQIVYDHEIIKQPIIIKKEESKRTLPQL